MGLQQQVDALQPRDVPRRVLRDTPWMADDPDELRADAQAHGIEIPDALLRELRELAEELAEEAVQEGKA